MGAVIRNQVGALVGGVRVAVPDRAAADAIPGFEDFIARWFPTGAANALAGTATDSDALEQIPAGLLLVVYTGLFVAAGVFVLRGRDVSA